MEKEKLEQKIEKIATDFRLRVAMTEEDKEYLKFVLGCFAFDIKQAELLKYRQS